MANKISQFYNLLYNSKKGDYMENLKFCFSQNISYFFHSRYNIELDNWLLYLSMNPIGFSYWGISDNKTILNGLNTDLNNHIARAEEWFGFRRCNVNYSVMDKKIWLTPHIIQTEDYYLPYHPSYQKNHYERFVITAGVSNQEYIIFDKELYKVKSKDLERAASFIFLFTQPNMDKIEDIKVKLMNEFLEVKQIYSQASRNALQKFYYDFCKNKNFWGKEHYNSLYFFITKVAGPQSMFKAHSLALYQLLEVYDNMDTEAKSDLKYKAELCDKLSEEWNIVGALCFKYAQLNKAKTLTSIQSRLEGIINISDKL